MNPQSFAIKSSRIVTPDGIISGTIVVERGVFADSANKECSGLEVIDCGDLVVSPGVIDTHVHINDPGTDWEGFESATAAAAAGGVTTLIDMPLNSRPVTTTVESLYVKRQAAKDQCHVDVGFYGGIVPGNEEQFPKLIAEGIFGLKAFLCHSGLDEYPAAGEAELRLALEALRGSGVPLLAHAEIVTDSIEMGDRQVYESYVQTRPPEFEIEAIKLLIELCREYQTPVHIVHLATAKALPMIKAAKEAGVPLTVETCPHYLFFNQENVSDGDTRFKCAPPIRDDANRKALLNALADGLIDTIGSDHSPCPPELKRLEEGDFSKAWGGIAGLQLTLPVMGTLLKSNDLRLSLLADRLSRRSAKLVGLGQTKGQIKPGFDADFVVWDPDAEFEVKAKELFHRHKVTPYDSHKLSGVVHCTYVRGQRVFDAGLDQQLESGQGNLLRFDFSARQIAAYLDSLDSNERSSVLETCCASKAWCEAMLADGRFRNDADVLKRTEQAAARLTESDWLEAFAAHPRIGDVNTLREKYANTKKLASGEQSGVDSADGATLNRLAEANDEYYEKFGFIFIVCATGKTAKQMLELLERRLGNDRQAEIANAAAEQLKITILRLRKLVP